jgi:large subunit ribosomal protein L4
MANKPNLALIKQAILHQQNNLRQATSATKTRGQVSGGGRKPWRQKGTGRARAGSSRSPIWVGGGITFGPTANENYQTQLPKKMAQAAFSQLLQLKKTDNQLKQVSSLKLDQPKTKAARQLLTKLDLPNTNLLLVTEKLEPELVLATNNLPKVLVTTRQSLSLLDLANYQTVAMESAVFYHYFPDAKPKPKSKPVTSAKPAKNQPKAKK